MLSIETMISYINKYHYREDIYYVVEKKSKRIWLFVRYVITVFNPKRNKTVSLKLWRNTFQTFQLGDAIAHHDPLFERICKITRDWDTEVVCLYRKMWHEYPEFRPEKFVEDLQEKLQYKNILEDIPKETLH